MKTDIATDRKANLLGSLWMIAAMAGFAAFGEQLTLSMVIGSGLIVLSGLFILWRSKRVGAVE